MHQYASKKSSCYRRKWLTIPKLPESLNDLILDNDLFKTTLSTGKRFLLIDCEEDGQRIIIFCSDLQLKILGTSSKIGGDGTFGVCPDLFEQVYILMAWYKGVVLPAAYTLLGGKKETTYRRMLDLDLKMDFRPKFKNQNYGLLVSFWPVPFSENSRCRLESSIWSI